MYHVWSCKKHYKDNNDLIFSESLDSESLENYIKRVELMHNKSTDCPNPELVHIGVSNSKEIPFEDVSIDRVMTLDSKNNFYYKMIW